MPTQLQYLGDASLKFEAIEVLYGPKGNTTRYKVFSPSIAALTSYYNFIIQFGASGTLMGADGGSERVLQVELPGLLTSMSGVLSELFFDQWELFANESSTIIFDNPILVGGVSPVINYNAKMILSDMARNGGTAKQSRDRLNAVLTTVDGGYVVPPTVPQGGVLISSALKFATSTFTDAQKQLALEILKDQKEYDDPTHVLRHTSYCSTRAAYNASVSGEMKIYTTAQLLSEVTSGWTYNLPARLYTKISSIPTKLAASDEASYYIWGWLKKVSREPVLANFIVESSIEYELGLWSNLRYSPNV